MVYVCNWGREKAARGAKLRFQMKSVITAKRAGRCVYTVHSAGFGSLPETEGREESKGNPSLPSLWRVNKHAFWRVIICCYTFLEAVCKISSVCLCAAFLSTSSACLCFPRWQVSWSLSPRWIWSEEHPRSAPPQETRRSSRSQRQY